MLIDWFTVFAQAVNFLILVWLLKRFLYKPILHAIDDGRNISNGVVHRLGPHCLHDLHVRCGSL